MPPRVRKSTTLRKAAHNLLNKEDREILKHVIRVYRHSHSLDTLCSSLSKIINTQEKIQLISTIGEMFTEDLQKEFLRRCENTISIFAFNQKHIKPHGCLPLWCQPLVNGERKSPEDSDLVNTAGRPKKRLVKSQTMPEIGETVRIGVEIPRENEGVRDDRTQTCTYGSSATLSGQSTVGSNYSLYMPSRRHNGSSVRDLKSKMRNSSSSQNSVIETLADRITEQLSRSRPSLSILADKGFWNSKELIEEWEEDRFLSNNSKFQKSEKPNGTQSFSNENECSQLNEDLSLELSEKKSSIPSNLRLSRPNLQPLQIIPTNGSGDSDSAIRTGSTPNSINLKTPVSSSLTPDSVFSYSPNHKVPLIRVNGIKQSMANADTKWRLYDSSKQTTMNRVKNKKPNTVSSASGRQQVHQYLKDRRELLFFDLVENNTEVRGLDRKEKGIASPFLPPSPTPFKKPNHYRPPLLRQSSSPMLLSVPSLTSSTIPAEQPLQPSSKGPAIDADQNMSSDRAVSRFCVTSHSAQPKTLACTQTLSTIGGSDGSVVHSQVSVNFAMNSSNPLTVSMATHCVKPDSSGQLDIAKPLVTPTVKPRTYHKSPPRQLSNGKLPYSQIKGGTDASTCVTPSIFRQDRQLQTRQYSTKNVAVETNSFKSNSSVQTDTDFPQLQKI